MTPDEFTKTWSPFVGKETSGYQSHFDDVCRLVGSKRPVEADPSATWFCFQKFVAKQSGRPGFADVFHRGHFGWEYKGNHKDLDAAYDQLLQYRGNLENPPLLIVSDYYRIVIRTNFNNSITKTWEITFDNLLFGSNLPGESFSAIELLRRCFHDPASLNPSLTPEALTEDAARRFGSIADSLRAARDAKYAPMLREFPRLYSDDQIANFLTRIIFCMFASDVGLLPKGIVTRLIDNFRSNSLVLQQRFSELFGKMATGGYFGSDPIPFFNGGLFSDDEALAISSDYVDQLREADQLEWSDVEPSIFGTLFERILDPRRRKQIGAHYTSRDDIELIVRPVLMEPLESEWAQLETEIDTWTQLTGLVDPGKAPMAQQRLDRFVATLAATSVLDPACGSGNFLYVSLALLKELEQRVRARAASWGLPAVEPAVHPRQLHGIEIDPYAHELASMVIWIGYLQWKRKNGIPFATETPILEALGNIELRNAIVGKDTSGQLVEPVWPEARVIVGNPPFLGNKKLRHELGPERVDEMVKVWAGRVSPSSDLCCYWFEKARAMVESGSSMRVGLLATQSIRKGRNRAVLKHIKATGDIFFAVDDRKWVLDGAAVRVSMIGFDDGSEPSRRLLAHKKGILAQTIDPAGVINADLTTGIDLTSVKRLRENRGIAFQGVTKYGPFDIPDETQAVMLTSANPTGRPNAEIIHRFINSLDLTERDQHTWIIVFPDDTSESEAALYVAPYEYLLRHVKPVRDAAEGDDVRRAPWFKVWRSRPVMQKALAGKSRVLATPRVGKHRVFVWLRGDFVASDAVAVFARDDDYFMGVLQSKLHSLWSIRVGSQLREAESGMRYTPTTCFQTFPMPWPPGHEKENDATYLEIATRAKELTRLRDRWLQGDPERTLTGLYNSSDTWLRNAHARLDAAVFAAYGWPTNLTDEDILIRLNDLNTERG